MKSFLFLLFYSVFSLPAYRISSLHEDDIFWVFTASAYISRNMAVILTSLLLENNKRREGIPLYIPRGCFGALQTLSGDGMGDRGGVISYAPLISKKDPPAPFSLLQYYRSRKVQAKERGSCSEPWGDFSLSIFSIAIHKGKGGPFLKELLIVFFSFLLAPKLRRG